MKASWLKLDKGRVAIRREEADEEDMNRIFVILLASTVCLNALAFSDDDVELAANALEDCVKPAEAKFRVYHYEGKGHESKIMDGIAPDLADEKSRVDYMRALLAQHFKTDGKYSFNLALDPVVSASYGPGENPGSWRLIAMDIPAGARLLVSGGCKVNPEAFRNLEQRIGKGCDYALFSTADSNWVEHPECTALKKQVFKKLGIVGIRFGWSALEGLQSLDWCQGHDRSAFVLTDPAILDGEKVLFYDGRTKPLPESRLESNAIRELACRYGNFIRSGPLAKEQKDCYALFPLATGEKASEKYEITDETKAWMKDHLLNCQTGAPKARTVDKIEKVQ